MNTQTHRIVSVLMIALMAGLVAAGWFLVAQPQLAAAADSQSQLDAVQSQIATSRASLQQLKEQNDKLPELTSQLAELQSSMPSTLASSPLVLGIDQEAASAGVHVEDISVSDPATYTPAAGTTNASGSTGTESASPSPTPTPSASATAAAASGKTAATTYTTKANALITPANFIPVPVSISVTGGWDQTLAFVNNLQTGSRYYSVGTVSSKAKTDDPSQYETTVTGYIYSILDPSSLAAAAQKKTASATPESSQTGSPTPTPTPTR